MKDEIIRQRRNLIGMSVALSVYELAGGELVKASVLFGMIPIVKPNIVISFAWLLLIYFLWRYWLHMSYYRNDAKQTPNGNKVYENKNSYLNELQRELANNQKYRIFAKSLLNDTPNENHADPAPLLVRGIFKRKLDYSYLFGHGKRGNSMSPSQREITIPYLKIFSYEVKAQASAMFKCTSFSDYELPYFISSIPFFIFGYKYYLG